MSVDANDVLFGGGIPAAKFESPGDTFGGPITKLEANQARKFDKGKPTDELDYWPNGDPKMVAVATLKTHHRDPSDPSDDGQRKLYIASRDMQAKVRDAVKQVGQRKLDIGGVLSVTFTHEEKSESGLMAKIYLVSYTPAQAAAANQALGVDTRNGQTSAPATGYQPTDIRQQQVQQPQAAQIPGLGQMLGGQQQQQPTVGPAAASDAVNMDNLPPEARALVERMLAKQQQG